MAELTISKVLCEIVLAVLAVATICDGQRTYSRMLPYDQRYVMRRVPVRRSAEAGPRIRMPITRYFPQVDTEVEPASYMPQEVMAATPIRLTNGEVYAVPSKWADEVVVDDTDDYGIDDGFEYEDTNPVYATNKGYALAEPVEPENNYYNNMMMSYLLGSMQQQPMEDEFNEIQRRSESMVPPAVPSIDRVAEENKKQQNATVVATKAPSTGKPNSGSVVVKPSPATPASQKKVEGAKTTKVELTGGRRALPGLWHDFALRQNRGQMEVPLYRPAQSSPMASLESQLPRKSVTANKDALPIIEKMMAAQRSQDPLKDQLDSLKFRSM